jgi:hypothetical protein
MKIFATFPSKYLKAADLHDKHVSATMSHVMLEELVNKDGSDLLPVLYFNGVPKGMVLNKTNAKAISEAYTDETENWSGMPIVLFPAMVAFGAETVEAIRVKAPSKAERNRAMHDGNREALAEHTHQQWEKHEGDKLLRAAACRPVPTTAADMERAAMAFAARKPIPRPNVVPLAEAMAIHAADGVIWDEAAERTPTEEERHELLTAQLKESLARANAALDERRTARGAKNPEDDLDIPAAFDRRPKPPQPDYSSNAWIELMQAAE